jgi:hypothetical protein
VEELLANTDWVMEWGEEPEPLLCVGLLVLILILMI